MWEDIVASFQAANGMMKRVENKINRGLRWPPTNKSHTTINKKHAGATNEGQERRFDSGMEHGGGTI